MSGGKGATTVTKLKISQGEAVTSLKSDKIEKLDLILRMSSGFANASLL
jgi:hypothetical protein